MKFKVLLTIQDRETGEILQPGAVWDDKDQRTAYEREILIAMGAVEALSEPVETSKEKTK